MIKTRHLFSICALSLGITLLNGCAKISTVKTNLDRDNFEHYFSPAQVTIYENEAQFASKSLLVGSVEGENCQAKPHLAIPDKIEARTEARRKAFELGANAIVFSGCAEFSTQHCHASIVCYGKAYQVMPAKAQ